MKPFKILLGILGGILLLTAVAQFKLLAISEVQVEIDDSDCVSEKQVTEYLRAVGKNAWTIDYEYLSKNMVNAYPCIKRADVEYQFPNKLVVRVQSRIPAARVLGYTLKDLDLELKEASPSSASALLDWSFPSSSAAGFLVEEDAWLYAESQYFLPVLFYPDSDLYKGKVLNRQVLKNTTKVLSELKQLGVVFEQSKINSSTLLIDAKPRVVLDVGGEIERQLASLQLILAQSTIDHEVMDSIDLRFAKPVVKYQVKSVK